MKGEVNNRMKTESNDDVSLSVLDLQNLYEGLTQEDPSFRDEMRILGDGFEDDEIFSPLQRTQNKLNYAMLGVHPIYRREVELAGMVDYVGGQLSLVGGESYPFEELDPSYVEFLNSQQRIHNTKEVLPLSSVALKTSNLLNEDTMDVPDISGITMNLPQDLNERSTSRKVLERAFTNSMVLMTHLGEMIDKHGFGETYGMNKDHLLQYVGSNSFNNSFEHSVGELSNVAASAVNKYGM